MIASIFHEGSGLGNQLHSYVMTRVLALDKGYKWGMINPKNFKGHEFMNIDMGQPVKFLKDEYSESKQENDFGWDVRDYDWGIKNVKDRTLIDGYWQGEDYYKHRLDEVREWLAVEPLDLPDNLCVIQFRGGEYVGVRDLFLPQSYWDEAVKLMRKKYPDIQFEVHTDDTYTAQQFFPDFKCIHDIGLNWRSIRYAKHLIVGNSSFSILPSLLGDAVEIIAPRFHAGYNKGYWQLRQNQYARYTYI